MGFFSSKKKENKSDQKSSSILLGMILLDEPDSMKIKGVVKELREKWKLEVDDEVTSGSSSVLGIEGYKIALGNLDLPIPGDEIKATAKYNFFWKDGVTEAARHKGHIILSVLNAGIDPVKENLIFTKVASSVLNNSNSSGVYIGGRTLLIKKDFYQFNVQDMSTEKLPLYLWIYFGLRKENGKQSVYTYGLADFHKKEMEIINSTYSFDELMSMMFNLVHYVLAFNVTLTHGETIGMSETQKLRITESKGKYLDGISLKIDY